MWHCIFCRKYPAVLANYVWDTRALLLVNREEFREKLGTARIRTRTPPPSGSKCWLTTAPNQLICHPCEYIVYILYIRRCCTSHIACMQGPACRHKYEGHVDATLFSLATFQDITMSHVWLDVYLCMAPPSKCIFFQLCIRSVLVQPIALD